MESIFEETDVYLEKVRDKLGKGSQAMVFEMCAGESVLEVGNMLCFVYDRMK